MCLLSMLSRFAEKLLHEKEQREVRDTGLGLTY